jgi:hypothetical protein
MTSLCASNRTADSTIHNALLECQELTAVRIPLYRSKMREFSPKSNANNETAVHNYLSVTTAGMCVPNDTRIALTACIHVTDLQA